MVDTDIGNLLLFRYKILKYDTLKRSFCIIIFLKTIKTLNVDEKKVWAGCDCSNC